MTVRYKKSELSALPFDFAAEVKKYADALQAFRDNPIGDPPTLPHPLMGPAIRIDEHTYVIDYAVDDDTPPAPTLEQQKFLLSLQVDAAFAQAEAAILSPARRNLLALDVADAAGVKSKDAATTLAAHTALMAKTKANTRHAAHLKIEIEELTDETIAAWSMSPFPHGSSQD